MVWKRRYVYYYIHIYNFIYIYMYYCWKLTDKGEKGGWRSHSAAVTLLLYEVGQLELIDTSVDTRETTPRHRGARRKDFERVRPVIWTFFFMSLQHFIFLWMVWETTSHYFSQHIPPSCSSIQNHILDDFGERIEMGSRSLLRGCVWDVYGDGRSKLGGRPFLLMKKPANGVI